MNDGYGEMNLKVECFGGALLIMYEYFVAWMRLDSRFLGRQSKRSTECRQYNNSAGETPFSRSSFETHLTVILRGNKS
jgi:hypothetical protein